MKTKKLLSIILAMCMLLSVVPMFAFTASAANMVCQIGSTQYDSITAALSASYDDESATNPTVIKLIANDTEVIQIDYDRHIVLDLNGKVLDGNREDAVIKNKGDLKIIDSNEGKETHKFRKDTVSAYSKEYSIYVWDEANGTEVLSGGCITGGYHIGKEDSDCGGAIYSYNFDHPLSLQMTGGNLVGNFSKEGGAIYAGGKFEKVILSDIVVFGNTTIDVGQGGGVYIGQSTVECEAKITNSSIINNYSGATGGGIEIYNDVLLNKVKVLNNTANKTGGGGINIRRGNVTLKDTEVTGNMLNQRDYMYSGGGVGTISGSITLEGKTVIKGNTRSNTTNNLALTSGDFGTSFPKVTIGTLTAGAEIGITKYSFNSTCSGAFSTNGAKTDEQYFFSDVSTYADIYNSNDNGYMELISAHAVAEGICTNGSVSVGIQKSAYKDETISLTATPDTDYALDSYKVYKTGDENTTVAVTNGKFTMPDYDVTVSATFKAINYVCYIDADKNGSFDGIDVKYGTVTEAITATDTNATTIRLIDNVTENVKIGSSTDRTKNITLDLNGKTLSSTGTVEGIRHNAITNFATLTVTDTSVSGSGKITGGTGATVSKSSFGGGVYNSGGSFTMLGGTISGNSATLGAGVANVDGGTFTMLGGTITGNTVGTNGGGVYNDGTIIIGGTAKIENNTIINTTTANNLYLNGNKATIATGDNALKPGAIIGVTLSSGAGQFTVNGENADKYHFFSDSDVYGVKYNTDGYLELVVIDYDSMPKMNFSANLTLAQNIDIGITVKKNESSVADITPSKLKIYANGEEVTLNDDLEGTLAKVEPKDIGTLTGVTVEYDGIIVKGFGYSVAKYCVAAFKAYANDSDTYASLNTLCEAILNYGKYAEDYANNNTASTVNAGHEIDFSKVNLPKSQKVFTSNTTYGAAGSGAYLTLESTVKLNYYVKSSFAYNNSDAKTQNFFILNSENKQIDPKKVSVSEAKGGYIISIDLYAYQLGNEYTLKVKDVDLKDFCITFGVYDYCTEVQDMSGAAFTDTLKTLCKAIYSYSKAAKAYSAK